MCSHFDQQKLPFISATVGSHLSLSLSSRYSKYLTAKVNTPARQLGSCLHFCQTKRLHRLCHSCNGRASCVVETRCRSVAMTSVYIVFTHQNGNHSLSQYLSSYDQHEKLSSYASYAHSYMQHIALSNLNDGAFTVNAQGCQVIYLSISLSIYLSISLSIYLSM